MKKNISVLLSVIAIFSLISCNKQKPIPNSSKIDESSVIIDSSIEDKTSSETPSSIINNSSEEISSSIKEDTYYHVTFVNYDNSLLYEVDVLEGNEALYRGEDPVKEEDENYTYTFIGWDIDLKSINSDVTAVAQFEAVAKENWGPINWF